MLRRFIMKGLLFAGMLFMLLACKTSVDDLGLDNYPPDVSVTKDQHVTEGDKVTLKASVSDVDSSSFTYLWEQTDGTATTISDAKKESITFTAIESAKPLVFKLTVTDAQGASSAATATVYVTPLPNVMPVANAGADIQKFVNEAVSITGSATDADGTVASYLWEQTAGTAVTISNPAAAILAFTAPSTAQTLTFRLTATDNQGGAGSDTVSVVVNRLPNVPPVANAGADGHYKFEEVITLQGSGSDTDGTIASYHWEQTGGIAVELDDVDGAALTFTSPTMFDTLEFLLTVTDNDGATDTDAVVIEIGFPYEAAEPIGALDYQPTDQVNYDTDADCASYEPTYHSNYYLGGRSLSSYNQIDAGPFSYIWGNDYSQLSAYDAAKLTQLKTDTAMQQKVVEGLQKMRSDFVNTFKISISPNLSAVDGKCYRTNIYLAGTGIYVGDNNPNVGGGTWCDTGGAKEIPGISVPPGYSFPFLEGDVSWMVAHEYAHTLQCRVTRGDSTGWQWYVESFANYAGNYFGGVTVGLDQFQQTLPWSIDTYLTRYGVWPFWMFLSNKFGYYFTGDALQGVSYSDESTLEFLRRISPFDCTDSACQNEAFANLYGEFAASTVNYAQYTELTGLDYLDYATNAWTENRESAQFIKVEDNRYRIVDWQAPQRFGHNVVELVRDPASNRIAVGIEGWDIPERDAQWRATVVATLDDTVSPPVEAYGETFKTGTQVINLSDWETELGASIKKLHLVVAATPLDWERDSELSAFSAPERYRELERYVYEVTLDGAWPLGHEPESEREEPAMAGAYHANGGGFVASTATVRATAYVGPQARVLGTAQVLENARIEGRAVVEDAAIVRDNAIVSSEARIKQNTLLEDYATVRDSAIMRDNSTINEEGKLQGASVVSGSYTISGQGMTLGMPLPETTTGLTIAGTAISDGSRWLSSGTVTKGTAYDNWSTADNGLLLKYDFNDAHVYRVRDVHGSSDAYYLGLDGSPKSAVSRRYDSTLASHVLDLAGNAFLDLPRWTLDQLNYKVAMSINWQGGSAEQYLLDVTTEQDEAFSLKVVPTTGSAFKLVATMTDREGVSASVELSDAMLRSGQWLDIALEFDGYAPKVILTANTHGSSTTVSANGGVPGQTRMFDYDTLSARLGSTTTATKAFFGKVDDFSVTRL